MDHFLDWNWNSRWFRSVRWSTACIRSATTIYRIAIRTIFRDNRFGWPLHSTPPPPDSGSPHDRPSWSWFSRNHWVFQRWTARKLAEIDKRNTLNDWLIFIECLKQIKWPKRYSLCWFILLPHSSIPLIMNLSSMHVGTPLVATVGCAKKTSKSTRSWNQKSIVLVDDLWNKFGSFFWQRVPRLDRFISDYKKLLPKPL